VEILFGMIMKKIQDYVTIAELLVIINAKNVGVPCGMIMKKIQDYVTIAELLVIINV